MASDHTLALPAQMSASAISLMLQEAREACNQPLLIDASALGSVSTQTVQFLLALSAQCVSLGHSCRVNDPGHLVSAAINRLGLGHLTTLKLEH